MPSPEPPLPKRQRAPGDAQKESLKSEPPSPANDAGELLFGGKYRPANPDHWARLYHWRPHEAACVTCGVDPISFQEINGEGVYPPDQLSQTIWFRTEAIRRAVDVGHLDQFIAPTDALNLLDGIGEKYPVELRSIAGSIRPCASFTGKGERKRGRQSTSAEKGGANSDPDDEAVESTPGQTKQIASLRKILLAVAIEKYRFQPDRIQNASPGRILETLTKHGLSLDVGTIRYHLKRAVEEHWDGGAD